MKITQRHMITRRHVNTALWRFPEELVVRLSTMTHNTLDELSSGAVIREGQNPAAVILFTSQSVLVCLQSDFYLHTFETSSSTVLQGSPFSWYDDWRGTLQGLQVTVRFLLIKEDGDGCQAVLLHPARSSRWTGYLWTEGLYIIQVVFHRHSESTEYTVLYTCRCKGKIKSIVYHLTPGISSTDKYRETHCYIGF